nr:uncharacterized protein LOC113698197 isoform X1 [Coffea arabica]
MDYLAFLYSGKGNLNHIYDICKEFYRPEKQQRSLTEYFMDFKRVYEELNSLLPFRTDVKTQQSQREQMAVMSFLAGLPVEFDAARTQILSSSEIVSFHDTFTRVLRIEGSLSTSNVTGALVSRSGVGRGNNGRNSGKNGTGGVVGHGQYNSNQRVCYHCKKPCHTIRTCWDLHGRPQQQPPFANFATQENNYVPSDKFILISADEFARFTEFQVSQKSANPSSSTNPPSIDYSGKPTTCLVSSSNKWVIDSGTTDHMTDNKGILSSFNPNKGHPNVTLADGSCASVVGSGVAIPMSSISLYSVLCLPNFSFNLLSVSKITKALKCSVSFFSEYCVFQDLMTGKIIGKGRESGGLYTLETHSSKVQKPVACSSTLTPLEIHCRLGHPFYPH